MTRWLGLDVGGANLKIANEKEFAANFSFPLWKAPDRLHLAIAQLIDQAPEFDALVMTMTGELADCYETREEGVCRILEQVTSLIPSPLVRVYSVDGLFLPVNQAARRPWDVAASNWHALAQFVSRWAEGPSALLIDIGSTTCDIIPILDGMVGTEAKTDSQRLLSGQLLYMGVERTSIASLVDRLPLHGQSCPVMREHFATTRDAYLWNGEIPESPSCCDTADGRPATRREAAYRLARMVGEDGSTLGEEALDAIADTIFDTQSQLLANAIDRQRQRFPGRETLRLITAGHGDFLISSALRRLNWSPPMVSMSSKIAPNVSRCGPAHAIACLASEQLSDFCWNG